MAEARHVAKSSCTERFFAVFRYSSCPGNIEVICITYNMSTASFMGCGFKQSTYHETSCDSKVLKHSTYHETSCDNSSNVICLPLERVHTITF